MLAKLIGVDSNSFKKWRAIYIDKGFKGIVSHGRIGFKPRLITKKNIKILNKN